MSEDVNCPYCNSCQEINHDDGYGYEEGVKHEQQCDNCNKNFTFETSITFNYETRIADCLNGFQHPLMITNTSPKCYSKMACITCEYERDLTKDEKVQFDIQTVEDYLLSLK